LADQPTLGQMLSSYRTVALAVWVSPARMKRKRYFEKFLPRILEGSGYSLRKDSFHIPKVKSPQATSQQWERVSASKTEKATCTRPGKAGKSVVVSKGRLGGFPYDNEE
jgi:hypothetical protein